MYDPNANKHTMDATQTHAHLARFSKLVLAQRQMQAHDKGKRVFFTFFLRLNLHLNSRFSCSHVLALALVRACTLPVRRTCENVLHWKPTTES